MNIIVKLIKIITKLLTECKKEIAPGPTNIQAWSVLSTAYECKAQDMK